MQIDKFLKTNPATIVMNFNQRFQEKINRRLHVYGITFTQALILAAIYVEEKATVTQLAQTLSLSKGGISQSISTLEAMKLVKRRVDQRDRRLVFLDLSPQGRTKTTSIMSLLHEWQDRLESAMGLERIELLRHSLADAIEIEI